jgi:hypothetical protein
MSSRCTICSDNTVLTCSTTVKNELAKDDSGASPRDNSPNRLKRSAATDRGESTTGRRPFACPIMPPKPTNTKERFDWQLLLADYLTGDELETEKQRIMMHSGENGEERRTLGLSLWLGLIASTNGLSPDDVARWIDSKRSENRDAIGAIQNFICNDADFCAAENCVEKVLNRWAAFLELFPSYKKAEDLFPEIKTSRFCENLEALQTWHSNAVNLRLQKTILQRWVGAGDLSISDSFVERILKEVGIKATFESQTLSTLKLFIQKARSSISQYAQIFRQMNLPLHR